MEIAISPEMLLTHITENEKKRRRTSQRIR